MKLSTLPRRAFRRSSSKNYNTVALKLQQNTIKIAIYQEVKKLRKISQFSFKTKNRFTQLKSTVQIIL